MARDGVKSFGFELGSVTKTSPYSFNKPSRPAVEIPIPSELGDDSRQPIRVKAYQLMPPPLKYMGATELSDEQLKAITRKKVQVAINNAEDWRYGQRREAQSILDFLYLGPKSTIQDSAFLKDDGISMILIVRDVRAANHWLLSANTANTSLGIDVHYIAVDPNQSLAHVFSHAIRLINQHLLEFFAVHGQSRFGRVLVTCETGNERSVAVVAAYILDVFACDLVHCVHYINMQRFCCTFDDEMKGALVIWQEMLRARRDVAQASTCETGERTGSDSDQDGLELAITHARMLAATTWPPNQPPKRGCDDMMNNDGNAVADSERFIDRGPVAPFKDLDKI